MICWLDDQLCLDGKRSMWASWARAPTTCSATTIHQPRKCLPKTSAQPLVPASFGFWFIGSRFERRVCGNGIVLLLLLLALPCCNPSQCMRRPHCISDPPRCRTCPRSSSNNSSSSRYKRRSALVHPVCVSARRPLAACVSVS